MIQTNVLFLQVGLIWNKIAASNKCKNTYWWFLIDIYLDTETVISKLENDKKINKCKYYHIKIVSDEYQKIKIARFTYKNCRFENSQIVSSYFKYLITYLLKYVEATKDCNFFIYLSVRHYLNYSETFNNCYVNTTYSVQLVLFRDNSI